MKKNYNKLIVYDKLIEDNLFKTEYSGKHFDQNWYKYIILVEIVGNLLYSNR